MVSISFDPIAFLERRVEAASKAKGIEEYRHILIELLEYSKELQSENTKLNDKVKRLEDSKKLESRVKRYGEGAYITLKDDAGNFKYCCVCWDAHGVLRQMFFQNDCESHWYKCPICARVTQAIFY